MIAIISIILIVGCSQQVNIDRLIESSCNMGCIKYSAILLDKDSDCFFENDLNDECYSSCRDYVLSKD